MTTRLQARAAKAELQRLFPGLPVGIKGQSGGCRLIVYASQDAKLPKFIDGVSITRFDDLEPVLR